MEASDRIAQLEAELSAAQREARAARVALAIAQAEFEEALDDFGPADPIHVPQLSPDPAGDGRNTRGVTSMKTATRPTTPKTAEQLPPRKITAAYRRAMEEKGQLKLPEINTQENRNDRSA